uniref:Ig-like domain-containing protein n=1 Tax=Knipowitschia caucasica TaxID=637954 RepID=A0AAV2J9E5_KNICA
MALTAVSSLSAGAMTRRLLLWPLLLLPLLLVLPPAGHTALCPKRCTCQNLMPSFTVLCANTGLLFVPPNVDRQTAELRLMDNFITTLRHRDFANMSSLEEFVCEPPMITRHTSKMFVMEGQEVSLRCKSIGDPEPITHWVSPDGKLMANTSRTICYDNGSLDILKASVKDSGKFTCIASNAAGEATAPVELVVNPSPHYEPKLDAEPGPSDVPTSIKSNWSGGQARGEQQRVSVSHLSSSSATVTWPDQSHIPGVRRYQVQYNSSRDHILIYRAAYLSLVPLWSHAQET